MAKTQANAYGKLARIVIVLFVLVLACAVGFYLVDGSMKAQKEENEAWAKEQNDILDAEYKALTKQEQDQFARETALVWPTPKGSGWEIVDLQGFPVKNSQNKTVERADLIKEGMMLLNHWHAVPADFPTNDLVSMVSVDKAVPVSGSSVKLFPNAAQALSQMLAAAKEEGLEDFLIEEGFRTTETQQGHYDKEAAKYSNKLNGDALMVKTRQSVNVPGTSEYQSGLSFRVTRWRKDDKEFNDPKFVTTEHSDWLVSNSWKYGFVFRFPVEGYPNATVTDKSYKTGESKKLSIYRYVGVPHATIMHQMDWCMEEYIEYLMANPHIAIYEDGRKVYELTWTKLDSGNDKVEVDRSAKEVSISMDNVGGVICCMSF